jgi:hypothetical protein
VFVWPSRSRRLLGESALDPAGMPVTFRCFWGGGACWTGQGGAVDQRCQGQTQPPCQSLSLLSCKAEPGTCTTSSVCGGIKQNTAKGAGPVLRKRPKMLETKTRDLHDGRAVLAGLLDIKSRPEERAARVDAWSFSPAGLAWAPGHEVSGLAGLALLANCSGVNLGSKPTSSSHSCSSIGAYNVLFRLVQTTTVSKGG